MNSEGFNTKAINGTKYADAIRSVVYGFLSAAGVSSSRVFRRDPASYTFEASGTGNFGRVLARSAELFTAAFEATIRQVVKSSLPATSTITAFVELVGRVLRMKPISGDATTTVAKTGHILASGQVFVSANASAEPTTHASHRIVIPATGVVDIQHEGYVRGRQYASVGAATVATAGATVTPHRFTPTPVNVYATMHVALSLTRLIRSKEYLNAQADGYVQSEVYRRLPFDENAPKDRTFTVSGVETIFYVTE